MISNIRNCWITTWHPDNIWEESDSIFMRVVKKVLFTIAFGLFGWWLVPIRDVFARHDWKIPVWICNNVPNGITVLIRGCCGAPAAVLLIVSIMLSSPIWLTPGVWLLIMVAMFCTDFIDGPLARQLGYVTKFGKEADPTIDKLISFILAVGLAVLSVITYGWAVGVIVTAVLGWLFWVEQDVARISIRTRKISEALDVPMHGAFGAGKIKFTLEAAALGAGYAWLVWEPSSIFGILVAVSLLIPARYFADKSRGLHRMEEMELAALLAERDYSNVIPLRQSDEDVA